MVFLLRSTKISFKYIGQPNILFRYLRNVRRSGEPKLLKGTVKTIDQPDEEYETIQNYQDFLKSFKSSAHVDDVAIEEALNRGEDFGAAIGEASKGQYGEDEINKSFVKKKIIGRKYFKLERETTLLTHAAKEQIRYLHRMDPEQWSPETLSQSFPITVSGVKKLLKSTFVMQSPERIQQHDQEVAHRWELLMSRTPSPLISPFTQRMWDEGKIMKEHYNGNPNLPNMPPVIIKTVIYPEEKEVGEYSAIIKQYLDYKKNKDEPKDVPVNNDELQVGDVSAKWRHKLRQVSDVLNRNKYHIDDETDDADHINNSRVSKTRKSRLSDTEVLHSQFKENLKDEVISRKFKSDPRYAEWVERESTVKTKQTSSKTVDSKELFTKISKFKKETFEFNRDVSNKGEVVYFYDDKHGYQYPKGKLVQSKIHLPKNSCKKGTVYKVGQSVYDDDGEFLYKIPK